MVRGVPAEYQGKNHMAKSIATDRNTLSTESRWRWSPVKSVERLAEELILSIDKITGEYIRLTRFIPEPMRGIRCKGASVSGRSVHCKRSPPL
jgi:hypothetical protein